MAGKWEVRIREGRKETRIPNKKPYTFLTFNYANEVRDFLKSIISYGMKPLDIKVFYRTKEA